QDPDQPGYPDGQNQRCRSRRAGEHSALCQGDRKSDPRASRPLELDPSQMENTSPRRSALLLAESERTIQQFKRRLMPAAGATKSAPATSSFFLRSFAADSAERHRIVHHLIRGAVARPIARLIVELERVRGGAGVLE